MTLQRQSKCSKRDDITIETYVDGGGPALVIIPSYGRDGGADYDRFTEYLVQAGFRVLRPQPRGIAGSHGPMRGVTLRDLADDIISVINDLAGEKAFVLGHAFGNFVARMVATVSPHTVQGVILASAQSKAVPPEISRAPAEACDLHAPREKRLAALRLAFFAPNHDASIWLEGWYPETFHMQQKSVGPEGTPLMEFWATGTAPILEIIPDHDPFKSEPHWHELKREFGDRVTTAIISDASHALFPEEPQAVFEACLPWLRNLVV